MDAAVLLIGRGGSGTRLLSQLALDAGVFLGNEVNRSGDSTEWVDLLYRIVAEAGGERELPSGSRYRGQIRATAERVLGALARGRPWGLKLPETMLVLPLLIDAFPRAKVVHLIRHPVSSSLRRTHLTSGLGNPVGDVTLPAAYRWANRDTAAIPTDEPYLHNAYAWNFQVTRVARWARDALGPERYLEVKYEELCLRPARVFAAVRSHLACPDDGATTAVRVDPARMGTWDPADPRIEPIWEICGGTATLLGYARQGAA